MLLQDLSGPLIGAVIGYCTNYIAVKMLFYPRKEIRIAGHRLPFTPGAIPKGQMRLAKAAGDVVGKTLLTEEDITAQLLAEETEAKVVSAVTQLLDRELKPEQSGFAGVSGASCEEAKERAAHRLTEKVVDTLTEMDLGARIAQKGSDILMEKVKGTMLSMFLSRETVESFAVQIGSEIQRSLEEHGTEYLQPAMTRQLEAMEQQSAGELLEQLGMPRETQEVKIKALYETLIRQQAGAVFKSLDISRIVEEKISGMDVRELERLVLDVMKKELNTIVNLGAVVGFLLGTFNLLF